MSVLLAHAVPVSKVGHGLMFMTVQSTPVPDEQCFAAIKNTIDAQPAGVKAFLNAGEFYGHQLGPQNLEMVARFFTKFPELADKSFLSVKGGLIPGQLVPDGSEENVRRSVNHILEKLGGKKRVDLYQNARVDPKVPIEDQVKLLAQFVKEGKFDYIGLSEVTEEQLRRAHAVHPIAAVEIQVSPVHYPAEIQAVIKAAKELGVVVVAYSPIGRGLLTSGGVNVNDLPADDLRRRVPLFHEENQKKFKPVVNTFGAVAAKKGITISQAAIAWVAARGDHVMPLPGSSHIKRTEENRIAGEFAFEAADLRGLDAAVASISFE